VELNMGGSFRRYVPEPHQLRMPEMCGMDARAYGDRVLEVPFIRDWVASWHSFLRTPFRGITTDGRIVPNLYRLAADGSPTRRMCDAARSLLARLSDEERAAVCHPVGAEETRVWCNPEFYIFRSGLRLEEVGTAVRESIMALVGASLSSRGFEKIRDVMRTNDFLGRLVNAPGVLNEWSYNFNLFGAPHETEPWGWNLFGHHVALNCFVIDSQVVISPTFIGAEPNEIDEGPFAGLMLFQEEEQTALELMRSLPPILQQRAQIYKGMHDALMPEGRWHRADQRLLGGAFQDNRIVPYEGIRAVELSDGQMSILMDIVRVHLDYLPALALRARLTEIERRLETTYFSWIGAWGDVDPFYYRIQSPVVMIEFDHKSGVFLTNPEPDRCHTHTVVRTPNGNDYGRDLLRLHYEQRHQLRFEHDGSRNT
jgi:hypothetical protein